MDSPPEYCEINSNITLDYINQILMEEGIDEKVSTCHQHDALQAMEKPFYDILGHAYPPSSRDILKNSDTQPESPITLAMIIKTRHAAVALGFEEANKLVHASIKKLVTDLECNDPFASKQMTTITIGQKNKQLRRDIAHFLKEMMKTKRNHTDVHTNVRNKGRDKKQEAVDLRALLIQCAQAIASNNLPSICN
ncbi:hypothetical protein PR202_ga10974 [Eleusine coracana subsp. coracana]|uniref:Uncharacterized protein n=1 Tax=Eleusine coracana subsp. coracana TaxID=191504 RepID=A0AAV5C8A4_ELECO|nr:hypothetical protein PR202_ga10974 [Eleusine coracana subsp. coracana]